MQYVKKAETTVIENEKSHRSNLEGLRRRVISMLKHKE